MHDDITSPKPGQEPQAEAASEPVEQATDDANDTSDHENQDNKITEEFGPPPDLSSDDPPAKKPRLHRRFWTWVGSFDKGRKIFYGTLAVIVVIAGILAFLLSHQPGPPAVASFPIYHKPTATTVASKLTGLQVDPAVNKLQVTGVMIENTTYARPQSGLNQAGIVFEAIAEAGITRFMALFQDTQSNYIGPVRSVRPYYAEWCQTFDCALAHVGGSPEALSDIKTWGLKNLDQFAGGGYFTRVGSRPAPHNVYTNSTQLQAYEAKLGYTSSSYTGFKHLAKAPAIKSADVKVKSISFDYPGTVYDVHYDFDQAKNDYPRSEGGSPHYSVDSSGNKSQNTPKVVIAMIMPYSLESDGYHSSYNTVGSGPAYVFQNGTVEQGTWNKTDRTAPFILKDPSGKDIALDPGQAWISVLGATSDVSYQ